MNRRIPILMYHSVSVDSNPRFRKYRVPPEAFVEQMQHLARNRYTPMTVSELILATGATARPLPDRPVAVTFDDGFVDFHQNVFPVLKQLRIAATLYVTTQYIEGVTAWLNASGTGSDCEQRGQGRLCGLLIAALRLCHAMPTPDEEEAGRPVLTWEQIHEVSRGGVEIGAHTHTHPALDVVPVETADREIRLSKQILEENLTREVGSFAYPFGYYSARVRRLVKAAGFTSACAVKDRASFSGEDHLTLSRLPISGYTTMDMFVSLVSGSSSILRSAVPAARARAGQTLRWAAAHYMRSAGEA